MRSRRIHKPGRSPGPAWPKRVGRPDGGGRAGGGVGVLEPRHAERDGCFGLRLFLFLAGPRASGEVRRQHKRAFLLDTPLRRFSNERKGAGCPLPTQEACQEARSASEERTRRKCCAPSGCFAPVVESQRARMSDWGARSTPSRGSGRVARDEKVRYLIWIGE